MSNASVTAKIKEAPAPKEAAAAATPFETQETVAKRTSVKLTNVLANGQSKRASLDGQLVWYDTAQLARPHPDDSMFVRVVNSLYSGVVVYPGNVANLLPAIPTRMRVVLRLGNAADIKAFREGPLFAEFKDDVNRRRIVACPDLDVLRQLGADGIATCYTSYVDDRDSLLGSINDGLAFDYLWIRFRDPTNIPLELVIA